MAILFVTTVSSIAIWRHWHNRVLIVDVSAEVQKTLMTLGADIDLRLALRDALNERLAGVQQIIAVQGLPYAGDSDNANAVSFAPFGVNLSTDTITQIVDNIFGRPPRPTVRLELHCAPRACDGPEVHSATLVMNFSAPSGSRNASYPVVLGNRGLTRSVHQSIEQIADLVLEQSDPLSASVLFLNRPAWAVFFDQYRPDLIRAEGAAVAGRGPGNAGCIADLVIGGSLASRGELAEGVAAEERAAKASDMVCQIQAESNIVFLLTKYALCDLFGPERQYADLQLTQARQRLEILGKRRDAISDLTYYRIPAAGLVADIVHVLETAGPSQQPIICIYTFAPESIPGNTAAKQLKDLLTGAQPLWLPPKKHTLMQHQALSNLWYAMRAGVPRGDLAGRLSLSGALMSAIRSAEVNDPHPRALFVLEGKLAMEIALASFQAMDRKPIDPAQQAQWARELESDEVYAQSKPSMILAAAIDRNLITSTVAFENASRTTAIAPLVELISDVEVFRRLGDTLYAGGQAGAARTAYSQSVEKYIEDHEPIEGVMEVTETLSRWAAVLIETDGCGKDASPDPTWVEKWKRFGGAAPDVCGLIKPDDGTQKPLLPTIQKLIRHRLTDCNVAPALPVMEKDPFGPIRHRWELLECYDRKGLVGPQTPPLSADAIDAEIGQALAGLHEP